MGGAHIPQVSDTAGVLMGGGILGGHIPCLPRVSHAWHCVIPGFQSPPCIPQLAFCHNTSLLGVCSHRLYTDCTVAPSVPGATGWKLPVTLAAQSLSLCHLVPSTCPAFLLQAHCTLHCCILAAEGEAAPELSPTVFTHSKHTLGIQNCCTYKGQGSSSSPLGDALAPVLVESITREDARSTPRFSSETWHTDFLSLQFQGREGDSVVLFCLFWFFISFPILPFSSRISENKLQEQCSRNAI